MNKPLTMIIDEVKTKIIDACNESNLPPVILDMIMQGIYSEIHILAERQSMEEGKAYAQSTKDKNIKDDNLVEGDADEAR